MSVLLKLLAEFLWTFLASHFLVVVLLSISMWVLFMVFLYFIFLFFCCRFFAHWSGLAPRQPLVSGGRTCSSYSTCLCSLTGAGPVLKACDDNAPQALGCIVLVFGTSSLGMLKSMFFTGDDPHRVSFWNTEELFPSCSSHVTSTPTVSDIKYDLICYLVFNIAVKE